MSGTNVGSWPTRVPLLLIGLIMAGCATPSQVSPGPPAPAVTVTAPGPMCHVVDGKADRRCSPGVPNPLVTQLNITTTICKAGWTATVRPPGSYTDRAKISQMASYGEPPPLALYEEDHVIPLEVGGDPRDPRNLFPQPYAGPQGARAKDREENALNRAVCLGGMRLVEAQAKIQQDWTR